MLMDFTEKQYEHLKNIKPHDIDGIIENRMVALRLLIQESYPYAGKRGDIARLWEDIKALKDLAYHCKIARDALRDKRD
jgi:hypothetical protein